jgi:predicted nucleic acid-binding protein
MLAFIEGRGLRGRGIGYVDAHLLASAFLGGTSLWTHDKRLHEVASSLGVA